MFTFIIREELKEEGGGFEILAGLPGLQDKIFFLIKSQLIFVTQCYIFKEVKGTASSSGLCPLTSSAHFPSCPGPTGADAVLSLLAVHIGYNSNSLCPMGVPQHSVSLASRRVSSTNVVPNKHLLNEWKEKKGEKDRSVKINFQALTSNGLLARSAVFPQFSLHWILQGKPLLASNLSISQQMALPLQDI